MKSFGKKIIAIDLKINKGKGNALSKGIKAAKGEMITFFDANLMNLSDKYITKMLRLISSGKTRAVLGYPSFDSLLPELIPGYTGERAYFRKTFSRILKKYANPDLPSKYI